MEEGGGVPYQGLFILFAVLVWAFELYLDLRQYNRLNEKKRPEELKAVISDDDYEKGCEYSADKISFTMLSEAATTMNTCFFYLMGGLRWLWLSALACLQPFGFTEDNEIYISLMFFFLFLLKGTLEGIPVELYQTFVIEARHGFNNQTLNLWISDQVKTFLLWVVIGGPSLALGILIIMWGGPHFYFYVWLFVLIMVLVFMTIYPNVIAPLFNTFAPLKEGELKSAIEGLAAEHKFPLKKLFVVDGSKRSSHSNAYFYGFGSNKRIVLFDTLNQSLLEMPKDPNAEADQDPADKKAKKEVNEGCTIEEIVAILGHEIGHWSRNHLIKQLTIAQVHIFCFFFLYGYMMNDQALFASFGFSEKRPVIIGLILFSNIISPVEHVINFAQQYLTRKFEYEADEFAVEHKRGRLLGNALVKISKENKSNINPDPLWSAYHNSHPSLIERLRAISAHEQALAKKAL